MYWYYGQAPTATVCHEADPGEQGAIWIRTVYTFSWHTLYYWFLRLGKQ